MSIAIILSGHVRNAFQNQFLRRVIDLLDADVYIHTWNTSEAKQSWRQLTINPVPVTRDMIISYLSNDRVKYLNIEPEQVPLIGRTHGPVNKTIAIPIVCQKQMWHGILDAVSAIQDPTRYKCIIRLRFDVFHVLHYFKIPNEPHFFIQKCISPMIERLGLNDVCVIPNLGLDNVFVLRPEVAQQICRDIYYNYDETANCIEMTDLRSQEYLMVIYIKYHSNYKLSLLIKVNGERALPTSDIVNRLGVAWNVKLHKIIKAQTIFSNEFNINPNLPDNNMFHPKPHKVTMKLKKLN